MWGCLERGASQTRPKVDPTPKNPFQEAQASGCYKFCQPSARPLFVSIVVLVSLESSTLEVPKQAHCHYLQGENGKYYVATIQKGHTHIYVYIYFLIYIYIYIYICTFLHFWRHFFATSLLAAGPSEPQVGGGAVERDSDLLQAPRLG